MAYTKTIVCLANSDRDGGRCIAGKEVTDGGYGGWIRPVSDQQGGEQLSTAKFRLEDGGCLHITILKDGVVKDMGWGCPQLLDVITIPLQEHCPHGCQRENHLIGGGAWKKEGAFSWTDLAAVADQTPGDLWANGHSSGNGVNDQIPVGVVGKFEHSLLLIQPDTLIIRVGFEEHGRKVRAMFNFNGQEYGLIVTDPDVNYCYRKKIEGEYRNGEYEIDANDVYMCISVAAKPFGAYHYKLVASVIRKPE